ncbi:condensation domain-containing protein, partial [Pseudoalteromonas sp. MMG007]|uniref:condensation domain-containing protein n=1 Tax=Pseudoalteromonas sp. MMG007 TaxID=2822684 RepID=UPI001B394E72
VMVEHKGLLSFTSENNFLQVNSVRKVASFSTFSFDAFVFDLFYTLANKATLYLLSNNEIQVPSLTKKVLIDNNIDTMFITTALFNYFSKSNVLKGVPLVNLLFGGEKTDLYATKHVLNTLPNTKLINVYGPTEGVVFATSHYFERSPSNAPIGTALQNKVLYVLDEYQNPVPTGVPGELYIGGKGIARGYLNKVKQTDESFVQLPHLTTKKSSAKTRFYKTGDIVRRLANGELEFIGRADHQIKLRGFRIELSEIESVMASYPGVRNVVAVVVNSNLPDAQIVSYVTAESLSNSDLPRLKAFAKQKLPDYMVPVHFMIIESIPMTKNGKIDFKALPTISKEIFSEGYMAPRTTNEQAICEVWEENLQIKKVSVTENFFSLGGNSLMAMTTVSQINMKLGTELTIRDLFECSTVAELSQCIERASDANNAKISKSTIQDYYPLSYSQQGMFMEYSLGNGAAQNVSVAIRVSKDFNINLFQISINNLIHQYTSLRTRYHIINGEPVQSIMPFHSGCQVEIVELNNKYLSSEQWEDIVRSDFALRSEKSLDILNGELINVFYYRLNEENQVIAINVSHIATDGHSMQILQRRLFDNYAVLASGGELHVDSDMLQYHDFAYWQRNEGAINLARSRKYWRQTLLEFISKPTLKQDVTDHSGDTSPSSEVLEFNLSITELNLLKNIQKRYHCSDFSVWMAILSMIIAYHNNEKSTCINVDFAGRNHHQCRDIVGLFVNPLCVVNEIPSNLPFDDVLKNSAINLNTAIAHSDMPFKEVVKSLDSGNYELARNLLNIKLSYNDFFQTGMNINDEKGQASRLDAQPFSLGKATNKYSLSLTISPSEFGIEGRWVFDPSKLSRKTVEFLQKALLEVLVCIQESMTFSLEDLSEQLLKHQKLATLKRKSKFSAKYKKKEVNNEVQ